MSERANDSYDTSDFGLSVRTPFRSSSNGLVCKLSYGRASVWPEELSHRDRTVSVDLNARVIMSARAAGFAVDFVRNSIKTQSEMYVQGL